MDSRLKAAMLVLVVMSVSAGLSACAKFPVVIDTRASAPSVAAPTAAAPAPTR